MSAASAQPRPLGREVAGGERCPGGHWRPVRVRARTSRTVTASLILALLASGTVLAETWRGLAVAPEHRCAEYERRDYPCCVARSFVRDLSVYF